MLIPNVDLICERLNELEDIFNEIFTIARRNDISKDVLILLVVLIINFFMNQTDLL